MYVRLLSAFGAIAATAATFAFATPAVAQEEARSETVSMAGLDLAKPADAARLELRLQTAVRRVCGPDEGKDLGARDQFNACKTGALTGAHADVQLALRSSATQVALTTK